MRRRMILFSYEILKKLSNTALTNYCSQSSFYSREKRVYRQRSANLENEWGIKSRFLMVSID